MACYHPLTAWQSPQKGLKKRPLHWSKIPGYMEIQIPCGQCIGCKLERSRSWAVRCMFEASMHDKNCFVTLTYDDNHIPADHSLNHSVIQLFLKRVRKECACDTKGAIKYYMCGEYGEECANCHQSRRSCRCGQPGSVFVPALGRPHYHLCLFNLDFPDKVLWSVRDGVPLYRSSKLERLWTYGYSTIGDVTFESAAYVARYCTKKLTGIKAEAHYCGRLPEYGQMSLRPGLGKLWWSKFQNDVLSVDKVIVRKGLTCKPPRYYDILAARDDPSFKERIKLSRKPAKTTYRSQLLVNEQVKLHQVKPLQRAYENGYSNDLFSS